MMAIRFFVMLPEETKMIKWHRNLTDYWHKKFNVDAYGLAWIAWTKGLVMGLLIAWFI